MYDICPATEREVWMMVTRGWAEDITHLLGVSESWCGTRSNQMLDLILDSITVPSDSHD